MPTIIPDRMLLVNRKMLIIHTFLRPRDWAHPNSPPGDLASVYQKSDRISKKGLMRAPPMVIIHVFLRVNNAWQGSNLGPERGGAQPSRQAAVVWREQFRGRVMRKGRPGTWPPRQRLTAPRQTLPALRGGRATHPNAGARDCAPPAMAGTHGAPQRSTTPATTGCPAARRACAPLPSYRLRSGLCRVRRRSRRSS